MLVLFAFLVSMMSAQDDAGGASCVPYGEEHALYHRSAPLDDYIAEIGPDDLYNSNGDRLDGFRAVLRQDRANVHAFGQADPADTQDGFFTTPERRALFETMNVVTWCYEPIEDLAERIETGTVAGFLEITVFESTVHPGNYFFHVATVG